MKALLRLSDTPRDFSLGQFPEPEVLPGFVKIKVAYTGICGSDLHIYLGQDPGLPQPVHGHEFSGIVAEVGEGVTGVQVGERVTAEHTYAVCGQCPYCKTGRYQLCAARHSIGFDIPGSFAEYVLADAQYVHKLPDSLSLEHGALTEPLACIVHAVELVGTRPAQPVLVIGPGPMGLLAGLVLRAYGCQVDVLGTKADRERLEQVRGVGLHVVDKVDSCAYPLVAECSGSAGGIRCAVDTVEKGGILLQVGIATEEIPVPYSQVVFKELHIQGTFCHVWKDWEQALQLQAAGLLELSSVITDIVPLEEWQSAFDALVEKKGMKILLHINEGQ